MESDQQAQEYNNFVNNKYVVKLITSISLRNLTSYVNFSFGNFYV